MRLPRIPPTKGKLPPETYDFMVDTRNYLQALTPVQSLNVLTSFTAKGVSREGVPKTKAAPDTVSLQMFRIRDIKPDYLICNKVNFFGTTAVADAADINVAKNWKLRSTPFNGKTILTPSGGGISYAYDLANTPTGTRRLATYSGVTETQIVIPEYVKSLTFGNQSYIGDIVVAIENPEGDTGVVDVSGNAVTWLDLNMDGRAWAEAI